MAYNAIARRLLSAAAGFFVGLALWLGTGAAYARLVAPASQAILRVAETPNVTTLRPRERQVLVVRSDVPRGSDRPGIPLYDLTFNVILLTTLFAFSHRPLSNRNVTGFAIAALILYCSHAAALSVWVLDLYASSFGRISTAFYSDVERWTWRWLLNAYRVLVQFALPAVLWWLLADEPRREGAPRPVPARRRRK